MHFFSAQHEYDAFRKSGEKRIRDAGANRTQPDGFAVVYPFARQAFSVLSAELRAQKKSGRTEALSSLCGFFDACNTPDFETITDAFSARGSCSEEEARLFYPLLVYHAFIQYLETQPEPRDAWMRLLFALRGMSGDAVYESLSPVERLLRLDPSGDYLRADKETRALYHRRLDIRARLRHEDVCKTALAALLRAKGQKNPEKRGLAFELLTNDEPKQLRRAIRLSVILYSMFSVLILGASVLSRWYLTLFILLPAFVMTVRDMILRRLLTPEILPRYAPEYIPKSKTLCVTTALVRDEKEAQGQLLRLEELYLRNRADNIFFGILTDRSAPGTNAGEKSLVAGIQKLAKTYHTAFYLFTREPIWDKETKKYTGWERKRGAIMQLCEWLSGKDPKGFLCLAGEPEQLRDVSYLVTLDADTEVGYDDIQTLIATASFPTNRPRLDESGTRVVSGYAVLQPNVVPTLASVMKTPFSKLTAGFGGSRIYHTPSLSLDAALTGEGIFCGKGLLHVPTFQKLIPSAFPEKRILSHDFLEGTILRCGYVSDVDFSDGVPQNAVSFYARLARWTRGDFQALFFTKRRLLVLLRNLYSEILPALVTVLTLLCAFVQPAVLPVLTAYLWLPAAVAAIDILTKREARRRICAAVYHPLSRVFSELFLTLSTLPYAAYIGATSAAKALYRTLVSHKKCLEWATASQTDRLTDGRGLAYYYLKMFVSVLLGIPLLVCGAPVGVFFGVLWVACPYLQYRFSLPERVVKKELTVKEKLYLQRLAAETWQFYADTVNAQTNWLPPDNIQVGHVPKTAYISSPTNIGMYLLSCITAELLGELTKAEFERRISCAVHAMQRLPRVFGHFYNWFGVETLTVRGTPYISLVDSGNLVISLLLLQAYLTELHPMPVTADALGAMAEQMDFAVFCRPDSELMSIGYYPLKKEFSENEFDLYMSESRSASFYALATHAVPASHSAALSRVLREQNRHIGMLSWSGTAFEYFMPTLWMESHEGSFLWESYRTAAEVQAKNRLSEAVPAFGISESAYYKFDEQGSFQYHAFGAEALAIDNPMPGYRVFAPYATLLMLQETVRHNGDTGNYFAALRAFEDCGMRGRYGFYDALDATGGTVHPVQNFMAHHQGMILASIGNLLFDGVFLRLYRTNPQLRATQPLLDEALPFFDKAFD